MSIASQAIVATNATKDIIGGEGRLRRRFLDACYEIEILISTIQHDDSIAVQTRKDLTYQAVGLLSKIGMASGCGPLEREAQLNYAVEWFGEVVWNHA